MTGLENGRLQYLEKIFKAHLFLAPLQNSILFYIPAQQLVQALNRGMERLSEVLLHVNYQDHCLCLQVPPTIQDLTMIQ